jgi:hypothetical protein
MSGKSEDYPFTLEQFQDELLAIMHKSAAAQISTANEMKRIRVCVESTCIKTSKALEEITAIVEPAIKIIGNIIINGAE